MLQSKIALRQQQWDRSSCRSIVGWCVSCCPCVKDLVDDKKWLVSMRIHIDGTGVSADRAHPAPHNRRRRHRWPGTSVDPVAAAQSQMASETELLKTAQASWVLLNGGTRKTRECCAQLHIELTSCVQAESKKQPLIATRCHQSAGAS